LKKKEKGEGEEGKKGKEERRIHSAVSSSEKPALEALGNMPRQAIIFVRVIPYLLF